MPLQMPCHTIVPVFELPLEDGTGEAGADWLLLVELGTKEAL